MINNNTSNSCLWRAMRALLILCICLVSFGAGASGPVDNNDKLITIEVKDKTVKDVLSKIEKESGYIFFYYNKGIDMRRRVSLSAKNKPVTAILDEVFKNTGVTYEIKGRQISLKSNAPVQNKDAKSAPKRKVTGVVTDADSGDPLIGVTVMADKAAGIGTSTNIDGEFSIEIPENASLRFSSIGYLPQVVSAQGKSVLAVKLSPDQKVLDDVVVVGYGTMQKKQVTSSITSIKGDDLLVGMGGSDIGAALQGKVSGLTIDGANSSPNSASTYQLRGAASISAGKSPLVVIDGVPGGDIRAINQEDIESIDVLKDASAGAIYGTKAAAGVILITTKKAKEGTMRLTYTGEFTTEFLRKKPEVMTAKEFVDAGIGTDFGYETDWYDAVTVDHPFSQKHAMTLQEASKTHDIYASLIYKDSEGVVIGDKRRDLSGRMNANFKFFDGILEVGMRLQAREAKSDQRGTSGTVKSAITLNPTAPLMDPDDPTKFNTSINFDKNGRNPVSDVYESVSDYKDQWLLGTVTMKLKIWDGLSLHGSANVNRYQQNFQRMETPDHGASYWNKVQGYAKHEFTLEHTKSYDAYFSYLKEFGANREHRVDATLGWTFWENEGKETFNAENTDFAAIDAVGIWDLGSGSYLKKGKAKMKSNKSVRERLLSFFGRASYSYNDTYMATVSLRRESSSKFGSYNGWGTFWSTSFGWRISKEEFMESTRDWLNDLKIRVAYGVTGNNGFSSGNTVTRLKQKDYWIMYDTQTWINAYGAKNNGNPDLKWEENHELNIGLDYALFDNRLWGKFDYFNRDIQDMIFLVKAPQPPYVDGNIYRNIGTLSNKGWELEIAGTPVLTKDFEWTTSMNFSHNSSKITKINVESARWEAYQFPGPGSPGIGIQYIEGSKVGQWYGYKAVGVDENGQLLIDCGKDGILPQTQVTADHKVYFGNAMPKVIISWNNSLRYRNFDFSMQMRSWIGHDVYNQFSMYNGIINSGGQNLIKPLYEMHKDFKGNKLITDYFIENGTFVKIDAITLGYTLNTGQWNRFLDKARFYIALRDVATFTKYKGMNPEVSINGLTPGMDLQNGASMYPQTIRCTAGVQLTF